MLSSTLVACLSERDLDAALPLLELLPEPILWVGQDHVVRWRNRRARELYGDEPARCYKLAHGRERPCNRDGELCPKELSTIASEPVSVTHAHSGGGSDAILYRVMAMPVDGGGVLEMHFELGSNLVSDALTGLYRREYWLEVVRRDQALLSRLGRPYALLFLDLDRFKDFNDAFGHIAGDALLHRIGVTILREARTSDAACRYGGDEIVLFLPNTTTAQAVRFAERCRGEIRRLRVETPSGSRGITASFGVCSAPAGLPIQEALRRADEAMYDAKALGRDRVCTFGVLADGRPPEEISAG